MSVKGRPARVDVRLPLWRAEGIAIDAENAVGNHQPGDGPYPLALHDFAKELRGALKEAEGER